MAPYEIHADSHESLFNLDAAARLAASIITRDGVCADAVEKYVNS